MRRLRTRIPGWMWFIGLAFACGVALVVAAFTFHDRCRSSDPDCIFHSYTLIDTAGPAALGIVAAPAVITLVLAVLLHMKVTRRSVRAGQAAWFLAVLSCLICFVGLVVEGFLMLLEAVLTVCAVAITPLPGDASDPIELGAGYFGRGVGTGDGLDEPSKGYGARRNGG
jgi:hypothetical protein